MAAYVLSELIEYQQPACPLTLCLKFVVSAVTAHNFSISEGIFREQAAAALVVGVGSFTDPPELQASPTTLASKGMALSSLGMSRTLLVPQADTASSDLYPCLPGRPAANIICMSEQNSNQACRL